MKNKKVGTIVVGGSPVDSIQYELIDKQFDCMAKYLSWDMLFQKSYYATVKGELAQPLCAAWSNSFETFSNFVPNLDTIVSSTHRNTGCVCNESGISFKVILTVVFINLE